MQRDGHVAIREAVAADAAEVGALHVACWREAYAGLLPSALLDGLSASRRAARWTDLLRGAEPALDLRAWVACGPDGVLVGLGACGRQRTGTLGEQGFGGEAFLLYVTGDAQRNGAGRALVVAMAEDLADRGYRGMSAWVLEGGGRGRRFCEALGGVPAGTRRDGAGGVPTVEVAYGWESLPALATRARDAVRAG